MYNKIFKGDYKMGFNIGEWVVNARKAAGITQEDLAFKVGFAGKASISAIEKGRNQPLFNTILTISEVCNYPLPYQNQYTNNNQENHNYSSGMQNNVIGTQNNFFPESTGNLKTIAMPDNSFAPLIPQSSELTYNTSDTTIKNGKIYLIQQGEQIFIRRAFPQLSGNVKWACENPAFGTDELPPDAVQIVGRVVAWMVKD